MNSWWSSTESCSTVDIIDFWYHSKDVILNVITDFDNDLEGFSVRKVWRMRGVIPHTYYDLIQTPSISLELKGDFLHICTLPARPGKGCLNLESQERERARERKCTTSWGITCFSGLMFIDYYAYQARLKLECPFSNSDLINSHSVSFLFSPLSAVERCQHSLKF